ncbi:MAG TPA: glycosyltransferase [Pyrinomonadaceae bacterium]|nr:glycosyltransferase [Pyrinomonadaceae bacterium]
MNRTGELPEKSEQVVCVISPQENAYSQTFVRAHKELLPAQIRSLYASDYENVSDEHGPLVRRTLAPRLRRAVLRRSLNLDHNYFQQQALEQYLVKNEVNAVLAEFGPTATLIMDACRKVGVPLIAHFHGFDAYRQRTLETYGRRYHELFEMAAAIIGVSRDMQTQLQSLGAPVEKLHYNSCGVDPSAFSGADPLRSPPVFVAVGRFVNKKAPQLTLLAFKATLEEVPDARLVMIGDGPLWEACYQMRRSLGLERAVELSGPKSHHEVAQTMAQARAFVQHSIRTQDGDSEGTPVAVLEAGASGLPVIATRHAGIKDAVIDQKTGLLVEEGDINGMAEQIVRLTRDAQLAADLGKAGREWISAEYSMTKSIQNLWAIIEATLSRSVSA